MVAIYASVEDVSDFLRIPIDATTVPNTTQITKLIDRAQDKIDRRTGHAWRLRTVTQEQHDLPLLYYLKKSIICSSNYIYNNI